MAMATVVYLKSGRLRQVKGEEWVIGDWMDKTQVDFVYDAAGRRTDRKNNSTSDVQTEYAYNDRSEMKSIKHWNPAKTTELYSLAYIRDGLGNPLQAAYSGSQFTAPYTGANKVRYEYDEINELLKEDWGHLNGSWTSVNSDTWTYDWVGNRSPSGSTWTYNAVDELTDTDGQQGVEYTYDMLGNLEYKPDSQATDRWRYYYSGDNLMRQVDEVSSGDTATITLTWDADKQRVKMQRYDDYWEFIYDPTASTPAVLFAKSVVVDDATYMYYVREPSGELLAGFDLAETQNKFYYHFDELGSIVLRTNGSGSVSDATTYGAWGADLVSSGSTKPYHYVGRLGYYTHDPNQRTGLEPLLQLGVRFYDPEIGRFTQRDPVRQGLSLYAYCADNPLRYVDPRGLACRPSGVFFWDPLSQRWAQRQVCDPFTVVVRPDGHRPPTRTSRLSSCAKEAACMAAGVFVLFSLSPVDEGCVLGCIASGPGYGPCIVTCVGIWEAISLVSALLTAAIDFAACMTGSGSTPCLDAARGLF